MSLLKKTQTETSEQKNLVNTVRLGFALVLALTVVLGLLGLIQLNSVNTSMSNIIKINNTKTELAFTMRDAIRLRAMSLDKMLSSTDYFLRDEELMKFYENAGLYRQAREQFVSLVTDNRERELHQQLIQQTQASQPKIRQVAERLLEEPLPARFDQFIDKAKTEQEKLLALLDGAIELQKEYANNALLSAHRKFQYTILLMFFVGIVMLLVSALIARGVTRFVAKKNYALEAKNHLLEQESERADYATRAKSEFLASMSHEIRTPLTTIIGFSESLLEPGLGDQEKQRAITSINNSGKHLHKIIDDVLDISKIEAGKIEIETLSANPKEIVSEVISIIAEKASKKGIEVVSQIDPPIPFTISTDPTRLKQILLNLCGNAVKFTNQGSITISVRYKQQYQRMEFDVADTGIGMNAEQVVKVFQPFQQADQSTTRQFGGTGLGLSISKQLAECLGGGVLCNSELGKGTTFTVWIDVGEVLKDHLDYSSQQPVIVHKENTSAESYHFSGSVLLAEDSPEIQSLIELYLNKVGVYPTLVGNGAMAFEKAMQQPYDLILMDMQMPVMNGVQAMQRLREQGYSKPIVALTANAAKKDKDLCIESGAQDYVVKPVNVATFYKVLSKFLNADCDKHSEDHVKPAKNDAVIDTEMQMLIEKFVSKLPEVVDEITQSYRSRNWQELIASSHRLKGAGGAFGYPELTDLSRRILDCAHNHNETNLHDLIQTLNARCGQISKKAS